MAFSPSVAVVLKGSLQAATLRLLFSSTPSRQRAAESSDSWLHLRKNLWQVESPPQDPESHVRCKLGRLGEQQDGRDVGKPNTERLARRGHQPRCHFSLDFPVCLTPEESSEGWAEPGRVGGKQEFGFGNWLHVTR